MSTESELVAETEKWHKKAEDTFRKARARNPKGEEMLQNIQAYLKDAAHFTKNGKKVHAFEAVVWAWALLEQGREFGALDF